MHLLFCTHRPKSNIHRRPLLSKQSHLKGLLMLLPRDEAPVKRMRSLTALTATKTHPQYWHMITLVIIKLTDEVLLLREHRWDIQISKILECFSRISVRQSKDLQWEPLRSQSKQIYANISPQLSRKFVNHTGCPENTLRKTHWQIPSSRWKGESFLLFSVSYLPPYRLHARGTTVLYQKNTQAEKKKHKARRIHRYLLDGQKQPIKATQSWSEWIVVHKADYTSGREEFWNICSLSFIEVGTKGIQLYSCY